MPRRSTSALGLTLRSRRAQRALLAAKVEASSACNGVGLVQAHGPAVVATSPCRPPWPLVCHGARLRGSARSSVDILDCGCSVGSPAGPLHVLAVFNSLTYRASTVKDVEPPARSMRVMLCLSRLRFAEVLAGNC